MRNPLPGRVRVPDVATGYHPFVDYRFVHAGQARWRDSQGNVPSFWDLDPDEPVLAADHLAVPRGISLRVQPADKGDPLVVPDAPWEHWIVDGAISLIHDQGRYRLWYESAPPDLFDPALAAPTSWSSSYAVLLCYAESDDAVTWRKPELGIGAWQGSRNTNIVFGRELSGPAGLLGAGVFVDPNAPTEERYRVIYMGELDLDQAAALSSDEVDPMARSGDKPRGIFIASSPDGLRWRTPPEPALIYFSDTGNIAEWDAALQRYVWYARGWAWGRRTIARAETDDLQRWPVPAPLLIAPPADEPVSDLYMISKTTYPGDPTTHLMFPALYDRSRDSTSLIALASADNIGWAPIPGGRVLEPGASGSDDAGCLFGASGLVELPGERVGIPYVGYASAHKHRPAGPLGVIRWATWRRGRLAGLVAQADGEFWTPPLHLQGRELRLNLATQTGGSVRVEVQSTNWEARDGYRLADVSVLHGDQLAAPVTWGERTALPDDLGDGVVLRFQLDQATLFGFELR